MFCITLYSSILTPLIHCVQYKANFGSHARIESKKSDSKSAASAIGTKSKTTPTSDESKNYWKESQIERMSDKEYAKNQEAIMEAMRTGKFVYDLSGAAR